MKRIFSVIVVFAVFGFLGISNVSCKKATGGGWIAVFPNESSTLPEELLDEPFGKATFGFTASCREVNNVGVIKVKLQFNDHYNNIKFHGVGDMVGEGVSTCAQLDEASELNDFYARGIYTPQPKGKLGDDVGAFELYVFDRGEPGASEEDEFRFRLEGGAYDGYFISGPLGGGNIQVF